MAKFRVVAGSHSENDKAGLLRTYRRGEVVDSASNLMKHNQPGCIKFEPVADDVPAKVFDDPVDEDDEVEPESQAMTETVHSPRGRGGRRGNQQQQESPPTETGED